MSCVLRAYGENFDVVEFKAKTTLKIKYIHKKGEPKFPRSQPDGEVYSTSGVNIIVSDADFCCFDKQKEDAIKYLKFNQDQLTFLANFPGIEGDLELDFGIEWRDVAVQCDIFPLDLVKLCGDLGIAIMLSQYDPSEEPEEEIMRRKQAKELTEKIVANEIDPNDACDVLSEICEALDYDDSLMEFLHLAHIQTKHDHLGFNKENLKEEIIKEAQEYLKNL